MANDSDLVWAKQKYSCYWPARIINTPPEMGRAPKNHICVLFFGTKQFGFVDKTNVESYQLSREKFAKKCRNNSNFRRAVDEMDEFISDPQKYKSNAVARVIKIKTEADIERHLGIKVESNNSVGHMPGKKTSKLDEIEILKDEKTNLITEIVSLKSLNQKISFELDKQKKAVASIKTETNHNVSKLNREIAKVSSDLKTSESKMIQLEKKHSEEKANDKKLIDKLDSERKQLVARVKQLQSCSIANQTDNGEHTDDQNVYEVDKLIADEWDGKTHYFLVRWKGYGREDDTWEKEKNLSCPKILEEYKKLNLK